VSRTLNFAFSDIQGFEPPHLRFSRDDDFDQQPARLRAFVG